VFYRPKYGKESSSKSPWFKRSTWIVELSLVTGCSSRSRAIQKPRFVFREELFTTSLDSKEKEMDSLRELLIDELSDLYSAEKQLVAALPKMAKASNSENLRAAFESHLEETKGQVTRLDRIFEELGEKPKRKKCKAMEGLIEEGQEVIEKDGSPEVKDAALIGAAQRVEHYEMAGYGVARAFAESLSLPEIAEILQETLDEEGDADKKLNDLALSEINEGALAASN